MTCSVYLEREHVTEILGRVEKELASPKVVSFVIDLAHCEDIQGAETFRLLALLAKDIKAVSKQLLALNASHQIAKLIRDNGLDLAMRIVDSKEEIPGYAAPRPKLDVEFINPFIDGAIQTFEVQCSVKAVPGKIFLKGAEQETITDIAGIIGLTSRHFSGSISICFPEKAFLALMGSMLGETFESISKDLEDGAAELLNIIFGCAKKTLNEKGYQIEKAIPTIVRGPQLSVRQAPGAATIILPFESAVGSFHIEIATEPTAPL